MKATFRVLLGLIAATAMLPACGGSQTATVPQDVSAQSRAHKASGSWMAPKANPHHPWLYVADTAGNTVYVYSFDKSGVSQIGEITAGINGPFGLTIDKDGNLYVANQNSPGDVTIYPPGHTSPVLTLSEGLTTPQGVAVDSAGNVYVTNRANSPGIAVYPPNSSEQSEYITSDLIRNPIQDFFDSNGNLFFSDPQTGVSEIPSGSEEPSSLRLQGLTQATGIALTPSHHLYVNNYRPGKSYVTWVYSLGQTGPKYDLKGNVGAYYMASGTIGLKQFVFAPDWWSNRVFLYRDSFKKPFSVIDTPGSNTGGVAFKPANVR